MSNIPTAEEVMQKHLDPHDCLRVSKCYEMTLDAMKEFAMLHVQQALKEAEKSIKIGLSPKAKDLILNAYPLTNIK